MQAASERRSQRKHPRSAARYGLACLWLLTLAGRADLAEEAARWDAQNCASHSNRADVLIAPNIIADRAAQTVRMLATSTGIAAGEPAEFVLVTPASDHAYEALAATRAPAAALRDALLFIGAPPGRSPNPRALIFWPKGERTLITVRPLDASASTNAWTAPRPVEDLIIDASSRKPPRADGFLFIDAGMLPGSGDTNRLFAPDALRPHAVVTLYNEPNTVCDVPRLAEQRSVYGRLRANPNTELPKDTLLEFTFQPEPRTNGPRVRDGLLTVSPTEGAARPAPTRYTLDGFDATSAGPHSTTGLTATVAALVQDGIDPYVRIRFSGNLRLDEIHAACEFLDGLERDDGIRVEPPEPDQLFYRAYIPDEENRRREDRVVQPSELRLQHTTNGLTAALVDIQEKWHEDREAPERTIMEHPLGGPEDVAAASAMLAPRVPVLLVFAPPDLTLAEANAYITPTRQTFGIIHVYLEPKPSPD